MRLHTRAPIAPGQDAGVSNPEYIKLGGVRGEAGEGVSRGAVIPDVYRVVLNTKALACSL